MQRAAAEREQLDALRISMEAEAARADAAEKRAAAAEAELALIKEADVQSAVSFVLAPGDVMAAEVKTQEEAWEEAWAVHALKMSSSCVM